MRVCAGVLPHQEAQHHGQAGQPRHLGKTTRRGTFGTGQVDVTLLARVRACVQDTAGQERFHALGPIYYRDSNGAVLVYDITDEDSFQKVTSSTPSRVVGVGSDRAFASQVKNWVKELRKMLGNDICLCIVGKWRAVVMTMQSIRAQECGQVLFPGRCRPAPTKRLNL